MTSSLEGEGGVWIPPKSDDVIYEQPLTIIIIKGFIHPGWRQVTQFWQLLRRRRSPSPRHGNIVHISTSALSASEKFARKKCVKRLRLTYTRVAQVVVIWSAANADFFLQFLRIFWFQKLSRRGTGDWGLRTEVEAKNQQTMHFCCRKAKNSKFARKPWIYGIFVAKSI